jgi:predicted enzyme related to lactoylglutathione lyase
MRLELVPLRTTDVDRSKAFYIEQVGFVLDHDVEPGNGMRVGVRYAYFSDPDGNSWALQQVGRAR